MQDKAPNDPNSSNVGEGESTLVCCLCNLKPRAPSVAYCHYCNSIKTIERQSRFKRACLEYKGFVCELCGAQYPDAAMCFRHTTEGGTKISKLTGAVPLSDRVRDELDKCQLVCANCERIAFRSRNATSLLKMRVINVLGGPVCSKCGETKDPAALDLHHTDPEVKTVQLSDRLVRSWEDFSSDVEDVVLLCANCHAIEHFEQKALDRIVYLQYNIKNGDYVLNEVKKLETQVVAREARELLAAIAAELTEKDPAPSGDDDAVDKIIRENTLEK